MITDARRPKVKSKRARSPKSLGIRQSLVVFGLLLLALAAPAYVQAGCVVHTADTVYLNMPSSGVLFGSWTPYSDTSCTTEIDTVVEHTFEDGIVEASSEASAIALCEENGPAEEYTVAPWIYDAPNIWFCGPVRENSSDDSSSENELRRPIQLIVEKKSDGSVRRAEFTHRENLPLTGLKLRAFDGMSSGIQFRRLDAWGIGIQEVLDMGFLDAVDVWSNVGSGFEVCFPQIGRIVFLDAATSPRSVVHVQAEVRDQYTCATMDRAGTMVLVEAEQPAALPTIRTFTEDDIDSAVQLADCAITPTVNLWLRETPWGEILNIIPKGTTVVAQARTNSWINVKYLKYEGWNAAWLTTTAGNCAWNDDGEREI